MAVTAATVAAVAAAAAEATKKLLPVFYGRSSCCGPTTSHVQMSLTINRRCGPALGNRLLAAAADAIAVGWPLFQLRPVS